MASLSSAAMRAAWIFDEPSIHRRSKMKLIRTEDAVGHVICHDMTRIVKGESKGPAFHKGHIVREEEGKSGNATSPSSTSFSMWIRCPPPS